MPCLLKQRTESSPGVITFTQNEVLWGAIAQSEDVRDHLAKTATDGSWIYGVHIQGDVSSRGQWPLADWQAFVMWPDEQASFLEGLPDERVLAMNCVSFLPDPVQTTGERTWDVCVVTRPSRIKRPVDSLQIIKNLLHARPRGQFVVISHDPRDVSIGKRLYERQDLAQDFFEMPRTLFTARELGRISFICTSTQAFGNLPLSASFVSEVIARSHMLLLTSHQEGTPRVIGEALLAGTPCAVSRNLTSGLNRFLDAENSLRVSDEPADAAREIDAALATPGRFAIDRDRASDRFAQSRNVPRLRAALGAIIERAGRPVDGDWYLEDLHVRLACHGEKLNYQLMGSGEQFFTWLGAVRPDPYDEDVLVRDLALGDPYARDRSRGRLAALLSRVNPRL
jgi:glycosyltransferase involved in cell wall biosynthesis